jgi:hypothetical protein
MWEAVAAAQLVTRETDGCDAGGASVAAVLPLRHYCSSVIVEKWPRGGCATVTTMRSRRRRRAGDPSTRLIRGSSKNRTDFAAKCVLVSTCPLFVGERQHLRSNPRVRSSGDRRSMKRQTHGTTIRRGSPASPTSTPIDHPAIFRHASAHLWQASAHCLQGPMSCAPHSFAHQSQISAHSLHSCFANGLWRAIASAHNRQMAAHSMQQAGQAFFDSLPTMCAKQ